eukprot:826063-Pleurochrysis_carterae.AAC.1
MVEAQMGNPKEAREYFRRAVDADSTHAHAWQARDRRTSGCAASVPQSLRPRGHCPPRPPPLTLTAHSRTLALRVLLFTPPAV